MATISTLRKNNISNSRFEVKFYEPQMIQELRRRNKVSQALLAKIINTSISTVQQWEIGYRQPSGPSLKLLNIIDKHGIDLLL